jgi:GNAT superfamily N-acetyltransferase
MRVLERIEGNPVGIAYRKAGKSGCALLARHLPVPSFNAIIGLAPGDEGFKRNVRPWLDQPGWSLFLGRVDGKAAAAAILYLREGFGYLADATTDPAYRGRGLQTALLAHRLRHAADAGAEYVCSGATFLSSSHRNMVRAGMTLQFVRALWTPGDET